MPDARVSLPVLLTGTLVAVTASAVLAISAPAARAAFGVEAHKCAAGAQVGTTELTVWLLATRQTITGSVYNLEQPSGLPLEFGIHVEVTPAVNEHIFLQGHVNWSGDYHEYFEIDNVSKAVPVLKSKLIFNGR